MSNAQGAWSYDSVSAAVAGLSDQCFPIEVPLADSAVYMYQFGPVSDGKGLREEWWRLWIPLDTPVPGAYFAIYWSADGTLTPSAADLKPDTIGRLAFGMAPADLPQIVVRVPRNKPFGYYRWSGGDLENLVLRGCRVLPPTPPPGE